MKIIIDPRAKDDNEKGAYHLSGIAFPNISPPDKM